jgi:hypothetical protein
MDLPKAVLDSLLGFSLRTSTLDFCVIGNWRWLLFIELKEGVLQLGVLGVIFALVIQRRR